MSDNREECSTCRFGRDKRPRSPELANTPDVVTCRYHAPTSCTKPPTIRANYWCGKYQTKNGNDAAAVLEDIDDALCEFGDDPKHCFLVIGELIQIWRDGTKPDAFRVIGEA